MLKIASVDLKHELLYRPRSTMAMNVLIIKPQFSRATL